MDQLDRLGWAAHRAIQTHGVRIGFRATRASVLEDIEPHLPPNAAPSRARIVDRMYSIVAPINDDNTRTRRYQIVYSDAVRVARTFDLKEALQQLSADIGFSTALLTPKYTFIHAGVVTWRGRAIVLPGASHAGKTTLVTALVRRGAVYYSDEWAVVDGKGRVYPYVRPLSIRGTFGAPDSAIPVDSVGVKPARVGIVALARFNATARWDPKRLSPAEAILETISHVIQMRLDPQKVLTSLGRVMSGATILEGLRGEADPTAEDLLARLDEERGSSQQPRVA